MLNEYLRSDQVESIDIVNCDVQVCNTGMPAEDSLNLGPKRLAKERVQRMRRRHDRSLFSGNTRLGWATRML